MDIVDKIGLFIAAVVLIYVSAMTLGDIYDRFERQSWRSSEIYVRGVWFETASNKQIIEEDKDKKKEGISDEERDKIHKSVPKVIKV